MAKAAPNKLPELSAWSTEILRLTAFHRLGSQEDSRKWWEQIVGTPPESVVLKPREGGYEVTGPFANGALTLRADFGRFDWLFAAPVALDKPTLDIPNAGPLSKALDGFLPLMETWLGLATEINRLAFGAAALQIIDDRVAGYKLLDEYLPFVEVDVENSSEFSYSINRQRKIEDYDNMVINRLSKWAIVKFQPMMLRMISGQPVADAISGEASNALRLEVDISTDANRVEPFEQAELLGLFSVLVARGKEIIEKGDIK